MIFFVGFFLFISGMQGTKKYFEKLASKKIRNYIIKYTNSFFVAILIGLISTAILQSSSVVSIVLISLLNAGLIKLKAAFAIIMGANIGTTLTLQLISTPIVDYYYILLILAFIFLIYDILIKRFKYHYYTMIVFNFAIIFTGFKMILLYFNNPDKIIFFSNLLSMADNLLSAIIYGLFVTSIMQSSSAVSGIILSLLKVDIIDLSTAIAVILGSNIGTCITAIIAAINGNKYAKSLAIAQFIYNFAAVIILIPFYNIFFSIIKFTGGNISRQLANAHTIFNIFNLLLFLPFFNTFISFFEE